MNPDMPDRFWSKVNKLDDGCWEWMGSISLTGYGQFSRDGKTMLAHRVAYIWAKGEIPEGLEIDHLCRNRKCVNPSHMELVTRSENIRRGLLPEIGRKYGESKTHCPQGHPYSEQNTYHRPDRPSRDCKICRKEASRRCLSNAKS